jgi:hypothetical protein
MLPRGDQAVVDLEKLISYVLNPDHRLGRNKARVFKSAFGLTAADADVLAAALRSAAATRPAHLEREDAYGRHFSLNFEFAFAGRTAAIRSLWVVRTGEEAPRFVSAFVL